MLESFQLYKTQRHDSLPIVTSCNWKRPYFARNDDAKMLPHPGGWDISPNVQIKGTNLFPVGENFFLPIGWGIDNRIASAWKTLCFIPVHAQIMVERCNLATQHKAMKHTVDGLIFVGYQFSQFSWRVQSTKSSTHEKGIFCVNYEGKCYDHKFWTPRMCDFCSDHENWYPRK